MSRRQMIEAKTMMFDESLTGFKTIPTGEKQFFRAFEGIFNFLGPVFRVFLFHKLDENGEFL
jgi:hypothetical protein